MSNTGKTNLLWSSVYAMLRDWDTETSTSDEASSLSDSQMTLPLSQSPVYVLASCSDTSANSSMIPNCSTMTYSDESS